VTNTPATFKQVDLDRAMKAAKRAGPDYAVRVTKAGDIVIERVARRVPEPELDESAEIRL
jgi:hypothetical protein